MPRVAAPSSTKEQSGEQDLVLQSTKKDNERYFYIRTYIGVDADLGLVHSAAFAPLLLYADDSVRLNEFCTPSLVGRAALYAAV